MQDGAPENIAPTAPRLDAAPGRFARALPSDLLCRKDAARFLTSAAYPITARTLQKMAGDRAMRQRVKGPPFFKFLSGGTRGRVYYMVSDLLSWAASYVRRSES